MNITAALEHEDSAVPIIDPSLSRIASRETYFVSLWKRFPELVASGKENANPTPTRIQSLERTPGGWELRLRTKNKSLSIFLSKQYDLVDSSDSASVQHVNHLQMVEENAAKREIVATREGRKTTLTLRIALLQVLFRDGEWRMLFLKTLYDPTSKLFWWETVVDHEDLHTKPTHQSMIAGAERQADFFAEGNGVFVGSEKIAVFAPSRVSESRAHFSNYRAGMAAALEQIEKNRGQVTVPSTDRSVHSLNPLVDVPKDFLLVCGHASPPPPTLTGVSRENGLWQITFAGAGHSAAVFLTDDYQIVRTVLSPAIPYPAVEETLYVCPIAASREGQETTIQARHIRISMYSACRYNSASPLVDVDVWIYFDPQTGLFFRKWGYASDSRWDATSLVLYLTGNELIEFQTSYDLGVRQGAERYTTVDDGVTHLLSELWLEGALDSRYGELIYDATLRPHLPEQFFPPPDNKGGRLAIESVSHKPDGWHLVVRGANDKRANVTLDKDLKVIDVKSQQ